MKRYLLATALLLPAAAHAQTDTANPVGPSAQGDVAVTI